MTTSPSPAADSNRALIVIDVQRGFQEEEVWGASHRPEAEANVARLVASWRERDRGPIVFVRHDSRYANSPLHPAHPGNAFDLGIADVTPDLLVTKQVNSAFLGEPRLEAWLRAREISSIVLCGIQTNMCVETTARMGGNLGFDVTVALDATRTFDLTVDVPGVGRITRTADELALSTAVNLAGGEFARIATTDELIE